MVYNGKAVYPLIWEVSNRGKTILISALHYLHYAKGHTHAAFHSNWGAWLNKLSFSLAHFGMTTTVMLAKRWIGIKDKITRKQIRYAIRNGKSIYTISPSLFPKPDDWGENLKVLGYHRRKKAADWSPAKDLLDFIENHKRILFITFGSMINPEPEEKTKVIIDILERNRIPAIINTASGGLYEPGRYDSGLIHFVSEIPYDRILPKIYGVIHHGGSGTTHLAVQYGCVTMAIPHIIDQFVWDKIIAHLGVGPRGIKIGKISTQNLEPKILALVDNRAFKKKAEQMGRQMMQEDFQEDLYNSIVE